MPAFLLDDDNDINPPKPKKQMQAEKWKEVGSLYLFQENY